MKGIILAGGSGSRLLPTTAAVNKQLLPVFDKPMIYYGLAALMEASLREILIITNPSDAERFYSLLGNGDQWGLNLSYAQQDHPRGIAEALIIGENFLEGHPAALVLGDNFFWGPQFSTMVQQEIACHADKATIFTVEVDDPSSYGVVVYSEKGEPEDIVEKPTEIRSRSAVTGLYLFPKDAVEVACKLKPSDRGELEISDVNRCYLQQKRLRIRSLNQEDAWYDLGNPGNLLEASQFVSRFQKRTGKLIGCPEELAYLKGWITAEQVLRQGEKLKGGAYGLYLLHSFGSYPQA